MGWAEGFSAGSQLGARLVDTYNSAKDRKRLEEQRLELERIGSAQPEQSQGFTAEQGDQVRAAAESGQYDVGYDEANKSYTVTPKADPSQTGRIGMQGVTDFNGQRTAGAMSESQVANARARGMAGVVMKSDPVQGMRMMRDVTQGERDDQRFGWEQQRAEREMRNAAKDDEYQKGRQEVFNSSVFGQKNADYVQQQQAFLQSKKQYDEALAAGKVPDELGAPPTAPKRSAYSISDSLADQGTLLSHDAKYGKVDPKTFGDFTERLRKVEDEGYLKALNLAQGGGPIERVVQAFNSTGQMKLDPKAIISDKMVKGAGGVPERVISYNDENGNAHDINIMSELKSLGKANEALSQFYQGETNRSGNAQLGMSGAHLALSQNADKRAQSDFEAGQPRKQLESTVATMQLALANASTPEERAAIQAKINAVQGPGSDKDQVAEVKLANAYRRSGLASTDAEALRMASQSKGKSEAEHKVEIFGKALAANMGNVEAAKKAADAGMAYLYPKPAETASAPLKNVTPADIAATAKKHNISEDEVKRRLNLK